MQFKNSLTSNLNKLPASIKKTIQPSILALFLILWWQNLKVDDLNKSNPNIITAWPKKSLQIDVKNISDLKKRVVVWLKKLDNDLWYTVVDFFSDLWFGKKDINTKDLVYVISVLEKNLNLIGEIAKFKLDHFLKNDLKELYKVYPNIVLEEKFNNLIKLYKEGKLTVEDTEKTFSELQQYKMLEKIEKWIRYFDLFILWFLTNLVLFYFSERRFKR